MEVEQAFALRVPNGMARAALRRRNRSSGPACRGDALELDVPVSVFQERDPLAVGRPQRPRLVPLGLEEPPDPALSDIEDADVEMVVDVRDEREMPTVGRPRRRVSRIAADRAFRLREVDDFLHAAVPVHEADVVPQPHPGGEGDRCSIGAPCDFAHDVVHVRELSGLAAVRVDDEDVVAVAVPVREERDPPAVGGPPRRGAVPFRVGDLAGPAAAGGHHVDVVVLVPLEVRLDRERASVRGELGLDDRLIGLEEGPLPFRPEVHDVDGPLLPLVRGVREEPTIG
jgi:hypothetical protein